MYYADERDVLISLFSLLLSRPPRTPVRPPLRTARMELCHTQQNNKDPPERRSTIGNEVFLFLIRNGKKKPSHMSLLLYFFAFRNFFCHGDKKKKGSQHAFAAKQEYGERPFHKTPARIRKRIAAQSESVRRQVRSGTGRRGNSGVRDGLIKKTNSVGLAKKKKKKISKRRMGEESTAAM